MRDKKLLKWLACLTFLASTNILAQSASSFGDARIACAQGLGQQAAARARGMGYQKGVGDLCVTALNWTANNSRLLEIYKGETGEGGAFVLVSRFVDRAQLSKSPFRSSGSPSDMWRQGELTPSLAFDAGFTKGFLDKTRPSMGSFTMAEVKRYTDECFNLAESLALCVGIGRIQGALAYQTSNAFSDHSPAPTAKAEAKGPDRAQAAAAIDRKFQVWSQSWSMDRYRPGSAQITGVNCSDQCKASGQFSFVRFGALHTIEFVAFLPSEGEGRYSLGRLCYKDDTANNMLDCTD